MVFGLHGLKVLRDETGSNHAWIGEYLPNIGVGACALSALAHLVYDNLFICIDLWSYT
jgi:hypothetical protein